MTKATPIHDSTKHNMPLLGSLEGLLKLVLAESGAQGYALCEFDDSQKELRLVCSYGIAFSLDLTAPIVSFSLMNEGGPMGTLDFAFQSDSKITKDSLEMLEHTAQSITDLLRRARFGGSELVRLTSRIAALEAQLADVKISERAHGLAQQKDVMHKAMSLRAHINSVLNSRPLEQILTDHLVTLECRVKERSVLSDAKNVLQRTLQLSEEDAYFALRGACRSTRSRLVDVAQQVRDGKHPLLVGRRRMSA